MRLPYFEQLKEASATAFAPWQFTATLMLPQMIAFEALANHQLLN